MHACDLHCTTILIIYLLLVLTIVQVGQVQVLEISRIHYPYTVYAKKTAFRNADGRLLVQVDSYLPVERVPGSGGEVLLRAQSTEYWSNRYGQKIL